MLLSNVEVTEYLVLCADVIGEFTVGVGYTASGFKQSFALREEKNRAVMIIH